MKYTFLFFSILLSLSSYSQGTFQKYYGGSAEEYGYSFKETPDGGFVVCGRTFSFGTGGWEGYVLKLNSDGDTLWTKSYGNTQYEEIQDIETTSDGGYIMTGHTWTTDWAGDVYLIKLDAVGNVVWDQTYGGTVGLSDKGYSVRQTTDGGYVISGTTETYGFGGDDVYVIKTSSVGSIEWTRTIGTAGTIEAGREIEQTSDGGYVVAGYTDGSGVSFYDVYLIKLNGAGVVQWSKTYGGSSYDFAYTVEETSDNGFILGATTNSFGAGNWDAYLIKTNSTGVLQWSKTYGMSGEDRVQAAKQTSDGGYILCGRSNSFGAGNFDATLHKTDAAGTLQWTKAYGGSLEDQAWYVSEYSTGGYALCGYSFSFGAGSRDISMIKTDATGSSGCNETSGTFSTTTPATVSGVLGSFSSGGIVNAVPTAYSATPTTITVQCETASCPVGANFTASNATICGGGIVTFSNSSSGAIAYQWILDGVAFSTATNTMNTFNTAGSFTMVLVATDGVCFDSTSVVIDVSAPSAGTVVQTACDTYTWIDGNTYVTSINTPTWTLTNAQGCDSIVTLNLIVNYSSAGTDTQTACDTYTWMDGNTYTTSVNTPTWTLTNAQGCDSIVTLNLIVNYSSAGTDTQTACETYTWMDGITYTTSTNTPTWTLTNAQGCDSIVTLNLSINYSNTGTDAQIACDSYTWMDGNTYTTSINTPTWTLTNAQGCDSIVTLGLTVNYSTSGTDTQTACDSYTWIDGNSYTNSTNAPTWNLTNAAGCDSLITLNLTINSNTSSSIVETGLDSYTAPSGAVYTASGIYNDTIPNAAGCDSIITIDLTLDFTGISELTSTLIKIFPNPVENVIHFDNLEMLDSKAKIKITNSVGQVVFNSNELKSTHDVSYLPAGVYIVFIIDTKFEHVARFIKK